MIIAREKRKTNIAEYILYMWQIEDLIRAHNFNLNEIKTNLVKQYQVSEDLQTEISDWYEGIRNSMLEEGLRDSGHLQYLVSLLDDLNEFHFRLIDSSHHPEYQKKYESVIREISELRLKMGQKERITDMEVCLTALYGLVLMRLKKKTVSEETLTVIQSFGELMALLADLYQKYETGKLEI